MLHTELPIYKKGCELVSLAFHVQTQMRRDFKRSLGEKITSHCTDRRSNFHGSVRRCACKGVWLSGRVNYTAQVDDLMTLIKAVAAGTAPIECIAADEKFLGAQARAFKKSGQLYPGVTAVAERSLSARAA